MNKPIIQTQDLAIGYNHLPIVTNITLIIDEGEFIGILGPNGSGKSTFLRALLGLIKPLKGELYVLGNTPTRGHTNIGYMPQIRKYAAVTHLTSRAILNASFDGTHYGLSLPSSEKKSRIQTALELVKATAFADRPFQQLSGGERQRVYLAQALLDQPRILLLDEPLASLDPHYQEAFIHILRDIQQQFHVTILFTAHDPNPLLPVMSRVLFFAKGKAAMGAVDEVITSSTLSALYGTHIEVMHLQNRIIVLGDVLGQVIHHD